MSQFITREFNNIYSELEILNNNILDTYNKLLELYKKKNNCKKIYKKKEVKNLKDKELELNLDYNFDLEIEKILSKTNRNKNQINKKKRTKKKKRIVRSVMVIDTSSESDSDN